MFNKVNHDFTEVSLVYLNNVRGQGCGTVVDGLSTVTTFIYRGYASLLVYLNNVRGQGCGTVVDGLSTVTTFI